MRACSTSIKDSTWARAKKSVAVSVTLQPKDATLTDAEIDAIGHKIVAAVEKACGGRLRA